MGSDDALTTSEAASISGYTDKYMRMCCETGALTAKKFGHVWMIKRRDLDRFMQKHKKK